MLLNSSCILFPVLGSELEASLFLLKSEICQALGIKDTVAPKWNLPFVVTKDQGRKRVVIILLYISLYNEIYIII